ncbi:MAG: oligosaccharide flippase family protein [Clostridiaceae bacterium]|nr:oligosaccharide flippase family protein [Clostridiaceae bacterium]
MGKKKSFLKSTLIYFTGNVLMKLMTFLLLPVYTTHLLKAEVGLYENTASLITFLAMTVFLNIWASVLRFMYDYEKDQDKFKAINNGLVIFFVAAMIYTLGLWLFNYFRPNLYMIYIYFYGLFTIIHYLYGNIARGFGNNILYVISGVAASLTTLITNIILIVYCQMRIESLYISVCVGYLIQILIIELKLKIIFNFNKKDISKDLIVNYLKFGIPLSISTLIFWFLDGYNKLYISEYLGYDANGLYSVAGKFSGALALIASCIILAWQEMAFKNADTDNVSEKNNTYSSAVNTYLYYMMLGVAALLPVITLIFPFLIKKDFQAGYVYVPFHILGTTLSTFMNFYSQIFFADKKTVSVTISFGVSAVINFFLLGILVPHFGIQGANYSVIISYIAGLFLMAFYTRSIIKIRFGNLQTIIGFLLMVLSFIVYQFNNALYSLAFLLIFVIVFVLSEINNIKALLKSFSR